LVFVTKYRHPVFTATHLDRMEAIMRAVCGDFGCELVEFNGETEHVHLLVNFPPTVALSRLVNSLKGVSSRRLRQEFPDLARHYWRARRLWSGSYSAERAPGLHRAATATPLAPRLTAWRPFTTALKGGALGRKSVAEGGTPPAAAARGQDQQQGGDPADRLHALLRRTARLREVIDNSSPAR
jgi:putative transposase